MYMGNIYLFYYPMCIVWTYFYFLCTMSHGIKKGNKIKGKQHIEEMLKWCKNESIFSKERFLCDEGCKEKQNC